MLFETFAAKASVLIPATLAMFQEGEVAWDPVSIAKQMGWGG